MLFHTTRDLGTSALLLGFAMPKLNLPSEQAGPLAETLLTNDSLMREVGAFADSQTDFDSLPEHFEARFECRPGFIAWIALIDHQQALPRAASHFCTALLQAVLADDPETFRKIAAVGAAIDANGLGDGTPRAMRLLPYLDGAAFHGFAAKCLTHCEEQVDEMMQDIEQDRSAG